MMRFVSWRTSVTGAAAAVLLYWQSIGFKIPSTREEMVAMAGSLAILLLGLSSRDAVVSSQEHVEDRLEVALSPQPPVVVVVPAPASLPEVPVVILP